MSSQRSLFVEKDPENIKALITEITRNMSDAENELSSYASIIPGLEEEVENANVVKGWAVGDEKPYADQRYFEAKATLDEYKTFRSKAARIAGLCNRQIQDLREALSKCSVSSESSE